MSRRCTALPMWAGQAGRRLGGILLRRAPQSTLALAGAPVADGKRPVTEQVVADRDLEETMMVLLGPTDFKGHGQPPFVSPGAKLVRRAKRRKRKRMGLALPQLCPLFLFFLSRADLRPKGRGPVLE